MDSSAKNQCMLLFDTYLANKKSQNSGYWINGRR